MKNASLAIWISLSILAGTAYAQDTNEAGPDVSPSSSVSLNRVAESDNGITTSTDPNKIAEIEQRAQTLQTQQAVTPSPEIPSERKPVRRHKKMSPSAAQQEKQEHAAPASDTKPAQ